MLVREDIQKVSIRISLTLNGAADKVGVSNELVQLTNNLVGAIRVDILIVVTGEEGTSILGPELLLDLLDRGSDIGVLDTDTGNDVEPSNDSPQAILLTDVVTTSSKTLLTADRKLLGVKEGAEELPAGRHLVAVEALGLGNEINGTAGRHGTSKAVDTVLLEVGDEVSIVGDDGQRVARRNKGIGAVDHVSVAITIGSSTEGNVVLVDNLDEGVGIGEVRVGVATTKVGAGHTVLGRVGQAEFLLKDSLAVGASDTVEAIEEDLEVGVGREELLDQVKVEDVLEHSNIVGRAVDDLDLEVAISLGTDGRDVDVGD